MAHVARAGQAGGEVMNKANMKKMLEDIETFRCMIDDIDALPFGQVPRALDEIARRVDAVIH